VAFKLTSQKPTQTLISLQAYWHVLLKAWPKHEPSYQGTENAKGMQLRTKTKVCAKVDKSPPSSFM
jgi:hypothetical protein